jgi:hypothetical protein
LKNDKNIHPKTENMHLLTNNSVNSFHLLEKGILLAYCTYYEKIEIFKNLVKIDEKMTQNNQKKHIVYQFSPERTGIINIQPSSINPENLEIFSFCISAHGQILEEKSLTLTPKNTQIEALFYLENIDLISWISYDAPATEKNLKNLKLHNYSII